MTGSISALNGQTIGIWCIALASIVLVLVRPKRLPEAVWATSGAGLLVVFRLISGGDALRAVAKGVDVYLFLAGMMIMSELARREGVFDWLAVHAVRAAAGSQRRLFLLVYAVGIGVTVLLSNDATAVVLTPAVLAAVRTAEVEPMPFSFACAFIANAASFVLPISNPANLVVYGKTLPPLGRWLLTFGLPSVLSIVVTFFLLRFLARNLLTGSIANEMKYEPLSASGKLTFAGVGVLAGVLLAASAMGRDLGLPACLVGILIAAVVTLRDRDVPKDIVREISWSVIPLVAGLFVIVEALNSAGAMHASVAALRKMQNWPDASAALTSAFGIALVSNAMNNLPSGLISGAAVVAAGTSGIVRDAILIGVDLGPNLSVTGSLATILWLIAIRREGQRVSFMKFLRWGIVVMPPALALAVLALLLRRHP